LGGRTLALAFANDRHTYAIVLVGVGREGFENTIDEKFLRQRRKKKGNAQRNTEVLSYEEGEGNR